MFNRTSSEKTGLTETITTLLTNLAKTDEASPEYDAMTDQLSKLMKLQAELSQTNSIKPDTWAAIVANLGGILIIVGYEQKHVITSKALPFIGRMFR